MKFTTFINENYESTLLKMLKKNKSIEKEIYIKDDSIFLKRDNALILPNVSTLQFHQIEQKIIDFIDKNYNEEFDLNNHLEMLTYSDVKNSEIDNLLLKSKTYSHKPLLCIINGKSGKYIVGYEGNFNKIVSILGMPKEDYYYVVLDGKFNAIKSKTKDGITSYVISPDYKIKKSDGITQLVILGKPYKASHIRRSIH